MNVISQGDRNEGVKSMQGITHSVDKHHQDLSVLAFAIARQLFV